MTQRQRGRRCRIRSRLPRLCFLHPQSPEDCYACRLVVKLLKKHLSNPKTQVRPSSCNPPPAASRCSTPWAVPLQGRRCWEE